MYKGLLICLVSLCTHLCVVAQDSSAGVPPEVTAAAVPDSAIYLTDLVAAIKETSKVILNWRMVNNNTTEFVAVERSSNGRDFEVVSVIKQSSSSAIWYEWIDDAPAKGRNVYRVRFAGKQGAVQYSKTIQAIIAGDISFRFYPNPVDNILIIRSEFTLDVQIVDPNGKVRLTHNKLQGLQTLNVASLEKGMYILRISNLTTGITSQERLLKN